MLGFFNSLFSRKQQAAVKQVSMKDLVSMMEVGLMIRLKFKHPDTVGIVDKVNLSCTRLNPNEVAGDRTIAGTISRVWYEPRPLDEQFIEVTVVQQYGKLRKYLFMSEEIESIEIL